MDTLSSRLASVVEELGFVGDWTDRYRLFVEWGESAEPLGEEDCLAENAISGCSSPLWLKAYWEGGRLVVRGASPGILPKALVAVVCRLFDGIEDSDGSVAEIMLALDLKKNLSPTRSIVMEHLLDRALQCRRGVE